MAPGYTCTEDMKFKEMEGKNVDVNEVNSVQR